MEKEEEGHKSNRTFFVLLRSFIVFFFVIIYTTKRAVPGSKILYFLAVLLGVRVLVVGVCLGIMVQTGSDTKEVYAGLYFFSFFYSLLYGTSNNVFSAVYWDVDRLHFSTFFQRIFLSFFAGHVCIQYILSLNQEFPFMYSYALTFLV